MLNFARKVQGHVKKIPLSIKFDRMLIYGVSIHHKGIMWGHRLGHSMLPINSSPKFT